MGVNVETIRKGSCHCGTVQYEARFPSGELSGSRCNCSMCAMKGAVMVYVPLEAVTVTEGTDSLSCYSFNTGVAKHHFCSKCGIHCFHQARSDPDKYAISAATLEGVRVYEDFVDVPVNDGQHHSLDNNGERRLSGTLHFTPSPDGKWHKEGW
ncbi:GFA family protein [Alteraurantiacibacter aquimixticola]|uniref:GFA family protein n=1 Tax=Alteraurantiacibacter aquimixticola TaxID=2489173 RepID=A0A4V4U8Z5_9SPHN|nr:GFA family protein [Alteraurantiacibacter aquimixticola]TIX51947.1 GFA family protein [Alteraurantiacibacter aquimixticola]